MLVFVAVSRSRTPLVSVFTALGALLPLAACVLSSDLDGLSGGDASLTPVEGAITIAVTPCG